VLENRMFRTKSVPLTEEVTGHCRKLLLLPIRVIKSRRIVWAAHAACMGEMRNSYKILVGQPVGKRLLGHLGADGKIILK
jgi:hypothetical protein